MTDAKTLATASEATQHRALFEPLMANQKDECK